MQQSRDVCPHPRTGGALQPQEHTEDTTCHCNTLPHAPLLAMCMRCCSHRPLPCGTTPCAPCARQLLRQAWSGAGAACAPGRLDTAPEPCRSAQARRRALGGTRGSARVIRSAGRGSAAQVNALPPTCARPACGARCWLQTTAAGAAHSCPPTRSPGRRLQLAADHPPIRSKQATRHHASGMRAQLIPMLAAWRPRCRGPAGRMA